MKDLFIIGFMGAGKTSVSARLGQLLEWQIVEMDQRIAEQEGRTIPEIFAERGEAYFRACETALLESFARGGPRVVSCGGGVPLREENTAAMRRCGRVILLTARPEVILDRVRDSDDRPLLQGCKTVPGIAALMEQRRPRYEAAADLTVDTSDLSIEEVCREILRQTGMQPQIHKNV